MPDSQKSFEALVNEAPLATSERTITLVGALGKSKEPGKFVLTLQSGDSLTLDINAVKAHGVLGSSVGQTLVRIDVDADKVRDLPRINKIPGEDPPQAKPQHDPVGTISVLDVAGSHYTLDVGTLLAWDVAGTYPSFEVAGTGFADNIGPNTLAEQVQSPIPVPWYGMGIAAQPGSFAPFTLATAPQASAEIRSFLGPRTGGYLEGPGGIFTGLFDVSPYPFGTGGPHDLV